MIDFSGLRVCSIPDGYKLNMGNLNACCEHTSNAPFTDGYKDPYLNLEFVPADTTPELKEAVKRRLDELATSTL